MENQLKSSNLTASFNLLKGFIGIGILTLSYGLLKTGWLAGILFFFLIGLIMLYLSYILIEVADKIDSKSNNIIEFSSEALGE